MGKQNLSQDSIQTGSGGDWRALRIGRKTSGCEDASRLLRIMESAARSPDHAMLHMPL